MAARTDVVQDTIRRIIKHPAVEILLRKETLQLATVLASGIAAVIAHRRKSILDIFISHITGLNQPRLEPQRITRPRAEQRAERTAILMRVQMLQSRLAQLPEDEVADREMLTAEIDRLLTLVTKQGIDG